MNKLLVILLLLGACSPHGVVFDGKRICLEENHYIVISDKDVPKEIRNKFDDEGPGDGILKITYKKSDPFYMKMEAMWGKPTNAPKNASVSISLQQLASSDVIRYQNHPLMRDAYSLENIYYGANKETLANGFIKVANPIQKYQWHIFKRNKESKDYSQELWIGHCVRSSVGVACEYFTIFNSNYLLTIRAPEHFIYRHSDLVQLVRNHIEEDVFCNKK